MVLLSQAIHGATIVVDETSCTLVHAIIAANTDSPVGGCLAGNGADVIELTTDVWLTQANLSRTGLPLVTSALTVEGRGHTIARAPGSPPFRLMETVAVVTMNDVTLSNGHADETHDDDGGAILISRPGAVFLNRVHLSGNRAREGGAIKINGQAAFLNQVRLSGNEAIDGGAISSSAGWLELDSCVLTENTASSDGGAIYNSGRAWLTGTTIADNFAGVYGGGIYNEIELRLTNCTVSGNHAGEKGGGIYGTRNIFGVYSLVWLVSSTVAANSAAVDVGGVVAGGDSDFFRNSIVVANGTSANCSFVDSDYGGNFDDDGTCGPGFGTLTGFDPILSDNGGLSLTHALLPGSSAIDAAGDCILDTDQRGAPRNDAACDSGAYEFQCSIELSIDGTQTWIGFSPQTSAFDIVTGELADLLASGNYSDAICMGSYPSSPVLDPHADPDPGEGRYFLARGLASCLGAGYGISSLTPDPRVALHAGPCP